MCRNLSNIRCYICSNPLKDEKSGGGEGVKMPQGNGITEGVRGPEEESLRGGYR